MKTVAIKRGGALKSLRIAKGINLASYPQMEPCFCS
jgi:hypothetical protein